MSRKGIALLIIGVLLAGGCSGMSNTNQRMLSGSAMGAGTGLLVGGPVGAVVGAGVGAAGGYAYDQHQKSDGKP
jgi:osmotically inducible lipoprotein OsmB